MRAKKEIGYAKRRIFKIEDLPEEGSGNEGSDSEHAAIQAERRGSIGSLG